MLSVLLCQVSTSHIGADARDPAATARPWSAASNPLQTTHSASRLPVSVAALFSPLHECCAIAFDLRAGALECRGAAFQFSERFVSGAFPIRSRIVV